MHLSAHEQPSAQQVEAKKKEKRGSKMTYVRPIFTISERYRTKKKFVSAGTSFTAGEILVFERDFFSPYDASFVYEFSRESDGQRKEWWLHEEQPADLWTQFFEPLSKMGP